MPSKVMVAKWTNEASKLDDTEVEFTDAHEVVTVLTFKVDRGEIKVTESSGSGRLTIQDSSMNTMAVFAPNSWSFYYFVEPEELKEDDDGKDDDKDTESD